MSLRTLAAFAAALLLPATLFAATVSGTVTNKTNNKPASGDEVTLIKLAAGMQESTKTKTDASGHYSIELPDPGVHLIRVTHQGANYFQPALPTATTVDIAVYDVASKVDGVSGEADVLRVQTAPGGDALNVSEHFFIKNVSSPQRTQFGERPFEFYLPKGAIFESAVAIAPQAGDSPMQSMPVRAAPTPLDNNGHYAFVFPIRPGETQFEVHYHLPYSNSLKIVPHPTLFGGALVVMMPTGMTFKGSDAFSQVPPEQAGAGAQTYAIPHINSSQALDFTISGTGQLPRDTPGTPQNAQAGGADSQAGAAPGDARPGGGLGTPVDTETNSDPWAKYKWGILSGLVLLLAAAAGFMLQKPNQPTTVSATAIPATPTPATPQSQQNQTLSALKEEIFALETERAQGHLSDEEYQQQKAALEVVLRRALARSGNNAG